MIEIRPPNNWGNLAGIPTDLTDGKITWGEVTGKPSVYPPEAHTHAYLPINGIPIATIQDFAIQGLEFEYVSGTNNPKNANTVSGLTTSGGTLLEANSSGNLIIGVRPNQIGDGIAVIFTDITADPGNANYTLCKIRIVRDAILIDSIRLLLSNLPSSSTGSGLPSMTVYRDSNNFLKIVP